MTPTIPTKLLENTVIYIFDAIVVLASLPTDKWSKIAYGKSFLYWEEWTG